MSGNHDLVLVFLEDLHAISTELVTIWLRKHLVVVALDGALVLDLALLDNADVDVGTRAQIVVNTSLDRHHDESFSLLLIHTFTIVTLHDGHSSERARAHSEEWSGLVVTIRANLNQLRSLDVNASDDAMSADLATIVENVVGEATNSHLNAALTPRVEPVKLQIALDHL